MVEFFVEIDIAGACVQLHKACGSAVISYPLARIETIPKKRQKILLKITALLRAFANPMLSLYHSTSLIRCAG